MGPVFLDSKKKQRVIRVTVVVAILGLLLGVASSLLTALAADAHTALKSISPEDGSSATTQPKEVRLEFSEAVSETFSAVTVIGVDGASATDGPTVVDGAVVTQPLTSGLGSGAYAVTYRVVSADGHPITGTAEFTLDLPPVTQQTAQPEATPTDEADGASPNATTDQPTGQSTVEPDDTAGQAAPDSSATLVPSEDSAGGPGGSTPILVAGGVLVLLALGLVLLIARHRQQDSEGPAGESAVGDPSADAWSDPDADEQHRR